MASPATRLRTEIDVVLKRMEQARDRSDRLTEADTKAAFIDPILSALGWDLRDVYSVSREYRHKPQDNPVDYALFVARSPVLFVEAKSLSKDLSDYKWISQTIAYANAAGVEWCALTNGDEYRIYNAFAKAEAERKLFRRFRLSDRTELDLSLATLQLLTSETLAAKRIDTLWREQFVDRQVREAVLRIFRPPDEALVRMITRSSKDLRALDVRESLRRADVDLRYSPQAPTPVRQPRTASKKMATDAGASSDSSSPARPGPKNGARVRIVDLLGAGVITAPIEIEATYRKQRLVATIDPQGRVLFDGKLYDSPSLAGGMARTKVSGPPKGDRPYWSTNGWDFWRFRDADTGELRPISDWIQRLAARASG